MTFHNYRPCYATARYGCMIAFGLLLGVPCAAAALVLLVVWVIR